MEAYLWQHVAKNRRGDHAKLDRLGVSFRFVSKRMERNGGARACVVFTVVVIIVITVVVLFLLLLLLLISVPAHDPGQTPAMIHATEQQGA